ncbi:MAG: hypothetical protein QM723_08505 [Myxococcaceae bacterium]
MRLFAATFCALALLACSHPAGPAPDAGMEDSGLPDAGPDDAGPPDAGPADAGPSDAGPADAGPSACVQWGQPRSVGVITDPALVELSGLAYSWANPHLLWAHNDSGDTARFFGVSDDGGAVGIYDLDGATALDWEDIAVGPCDAGSCVFLGDIGDNNLVRPTHTVYAVPEPAAPLAGEHHLQTFDRYPFQYPNGDKHNAETLLVHPGSGTIYVVTKETPGVRSSVFRFPMPLQPGQLVTLEPVTMMKVPATSDFQLTAGDIDRTGRRLLLRMYNRAVLLDLDAGAAFETIFDADPVQVPTANEPQGEAIAWGPDSHAYFTSSETAGGPAVPLYEIDCMP